MAAANAPGRPARRGCRAALLSLPLPLRTRPCLRPRLRTRAAGSTSRVSLPVISQVPRGPCTCTRVNRGVSAG